MSQFLKQNQPPAAAPPAAAPPSDPPPAAAAPPADPPPAAAPPADPPPSDPPPAENWFNGLPEGVQAWDEVTTAKDADSFWKQMENLRSSMGSSIRIPSEEASADDKAAFMKKVLDKSPELMMRPAEGSMDEFYSQLGKPGEASAYSAPELEMPEGMAFDDAVMGGYRELAHKFNLTDAQFKGIMGEIIGNDLQSNSHAQEQHKQQMQSLNTEWGMKFDANIAAATKVAEQTGAPAALLADMQAGTASADTMKYFAGLAKMFGTEGVTLTNTQTGIEVHDPAAARTKISDIFNNKQHPYWNTSDPGHVDAKKLVATLHEQAYPGDAPDGVNVMGSNTSM